MCRSQDLGTECGKSRFEIRNLLADVRCSQAVLDFLSATDVGRLVPAEEDADSETPEWELHERREREEQRRPEAEELGAEDKGLNSPAGPVLASAWPGLRDTVHASPRPAGSPAFLAPAWSGPGQPAGWENEGDLMIH